MPATAGTAVTPAVQQPGQQARQLVQPSRAAAALVLLELPELLVLVGKLLLRLRLRVWAVALVLVGLVGLALVVLVVRHGQGLR